MELIDGVEEGVKGKGVWAGTTKATTSRTTCSNVLFVFYVYESVSGVQGDNHQQGREVCLVRRWQGVGCDPSAKRREQENTISFT